MRNVILSLALLLSVTGTAGAEQLNLKECLNRAAANNGGLKAASYEISVAREQIGIAKSGLLPKVDLQGGYVAQLQAQAVQFGPNSLETQDADYPFLSLSIYQTLYDFGRSHARDSYASAHRSQTEIATQFFGGEKCHIAGKSAHVARRGRATPRSSRQCR